MLKARTREARMNADYLPVQLYEAQTQAVLAVSSARQQLIAEYEDKLRLLELEHQQRRREELDEAEARFDAKLDILRRMEEAGRTGPAGRTRDADVSYDDSDEEESFVSEVGEEVREMLSPTRKGGEADLLTEEEGTDAEESLAITDNSLVSEEAEEDSIILLSGDDEPEQEADSDSGTPRASFSSVADDAEADEDEPVAVPVEVDAEGCKSSKKPKRKLGGKVTDVEEIENLVDEFGSAPGGTAGRSLTARPGKW